MRPLRYLLWALAAVALIVFMFLLVRPPSNAPDTRPPPQPSGMATFGGPFTLVGSDGQPFPSSRLNGKPYAVFFGFTHCPDVCPATLAELSVLVEDLGEDGENVDVYFVSVDPERDDPETLRTYLSSFSGRIHGLTGSVEEIEEFVASYRAYVRKVPTEGGDYTVDHTASVYLFDADGRFRGTIGYGESHDDALAKLRRLLEA